MIGFAEICKNRSLPGGEDMLMSYHDCEGKYKSYYQIKKALDAGQLYKIAPGIYADRPNVTELEIISFQYAQAVFTMDSAFFYHGMTDVIPEKYHLATAKDAYKIGGTRIRQYFHRGDIFPIGIMSMQYRSTTIRIYDRERMLIELFRNKKSLPFDYYKEIIESYRRTIKTLDLEKLQEYMFAFPKQNHIWKAIELEVM